MGSRKTTLVHAIVDIVVHPFIQFVNLPPQLFRVKVQILGLSFGKQFIETGVEEPDDFARLVVHNSARNFVPDDRDCETGIVVGIGLVVDFRKVGETKEVILRRTGERVIRVLGDGSRVSSSFRGNKVPSAFV